MDLSLKVNEAEKMRKLAWYVRYAGLWHNASDVKPVTEDFIAMVQKHFHFNLCLWNGMGAQA